MILASMRMKRIDARKGNEGEQPDPRFPAEQVDETGVSSWVLFLPIGLGYRGHPRRNLEILQK